MSSQFENDNLLLSGEESLMPVMDRRDAFAGRRGNQRRAIIVKRSASQATAVCILGMHRSGTSCITRAFNLLGIYLGEEAAVKGFGPDNPVGFWEHPEIRDLHARLLARFDRTWDSTAPLPNQWHATDAIRPFREELQRLVRVNFAGQSLWAWKDPRSCLLLPLWRDVLAELETRLLCVFVVRNPLDVFNSLRKRDPIPFRKAMGLWFSYYLAALQGAAGLPAVFLNYDRFLVNWEPELRRCMTALDLEWPVDEPRLRDRMNSFIRPELCHHHSASDQLLCAPEPVRELCEILMEAGTKVAVRDDHFEAALNRLSHANLDFLSQSDHEEPAERWNYLKRTWRRWQRSYRKRFPRAVSRTTLQNS